MNEKPTIIGAGICGLTTALTYKNRNIDFSLYESADEIKPVGAGILLAINATQVYQKMGLYDQIVSKGNKITNLYVTDNMLRPISRVDLTEYEKKYGVTGIAIHRGELQNILATEVGYENIHLSKRLSNIERNDTFNLTFEDGTTIDTDILIGADGIHSMVREKLFEKSTIRNAGQVCWRGVCEFDLDTKFHSEMNEMWGVGKRFGFMKISDKKVYWFALVNYKKFNEQKVDLAELFSDFHEIVGKIISATDTNQIFRNYIEDLKPIPHWQQKNVCLVGDAAHATTPNMGQGACQAIEDAYVLGLLLDRGMTVSDSFETYEKMRKQKAIYVVNNSWTFGKMAQLDSNFMVNIRNVFLRNLPSSFNKKQLDRLFDIEY